MCVNTSRRNRGTAVELDANSWSEQSKRSCLYMATGCNGMTLYILLPWRSCN